MLCKFLYLKTEITAKMCGTERSTPADTEECAYLWGGE